MEQQETKSEILKAEILKNLDDLVSKNSVQFKQPGNFFAHRHHHRDQRATSNGAKVRSK